jgi:hypothetical protein
MFAAAKLNAKDANASAKDRRQKKRREVLTDLQTELAEFVGLDKQIKQLERRKKVLHDCILSAAKDRFLEVYRDEDRSPGSFEVGEGVLVVPMDRFRKLSKDDAVDMQKKYYEDIIVETIEYSFNTDMIAKHSDAVSDAIMSSGDIEEDDKLKIIIATTSHQVRKGSLSTIPSEHRTIEFLQDVGAIWCLKT